MASKPNLIGLYSNRPQQGKSTVAGMMEVDHHFQRTSFAAPLRAMLTPLLISLGVFNPEEVLGGDKSSIIPGTNTSVRSAMRTLGTEWGRALVDDGIWVTAAFQPIDRLFKQFPSARIVFDDMRFPNEFDAIKERGGQVWHIGNDHGDYQPSGHASDGALSNFTFDKYLPNFGSLEALRKDVNFHLGASRQLLQGL